ncbi:MAG: ABC transporter permease [Clostridiales bacterium]|nr:ABC transporter permease [Clostridiales bacterium]
MQTSASGAPRLRIVKRDSLPLWKSVVIRLLAVLLALLVDAVLIYCIVNMNPVEVYKTMFSGAFGTSRRAWITARDTALLLCMSVGLAPAFKMRFWNTGAEGQILVGAICTAFCMINFADILPTGLLLVVMALASIVGGGIWGLIPAVFKARWDTNETLFTLMLNYVAIQLTSFCVACWENPYGSNTVGIINQNSQIGWFPSLFGASYGLNILLAVLLTVGMFCYLRYTKQGYEIAVVGESRNTARYAGVSITKVYIRTMIISGAICGFSGFIAVAGSSHTVSTSTAGGRGFTAIIVAWLAKFNTFFMVVISLLLVFLEKGASEIASQYNLNEYAAQMIEGVILFFILGSEFFLNYRLVRPGKEKEGK